MLADDLKRTDIWHRVQNRRALQRHDHLYCIAYDESWVCDAIVASADSRSVGLVVGRIHAFPERTRPLFSDENYRVLWTGSGYAIERKKDGQRVSNNT